ncbi:MAG: hypothetical protein RIE56_06680 [Amphiplicatus sp.]
MELQTIPLDRLAVSALNMRASRKKPYLDDILPSRRQLRDDAINTSFQYLQEPQ